MQTSVSESRIFGKMYLSTIAQHLKQVIGYEFVDPSVVSLQYSQYLSVDYKTLL